MRNQIKTPGLVWHQPCKRLSLAKTWPVQHHLILPSTDQYLSTISDLLCHFMGKTPLSFKLVIGQNIVAYCTRNFTQEVNNHWWCHSEVSQQELNVGIQCAKPLSRLSEKNDSTFLVGGILRRTRLAFCIDGTLFMASDMDRLHKSTDFLRS